MKNSTCDHYSLRLRVFALIFRFYNPKKYLTQRRKERRGKTRTLMKSSNCDHSSLRLRVFALIFRFYNPKKYLTQRRKERRGKTRTFMKKSTCDHYSLRLRVFASLRLCVNELLKLNFAFVWVIAPFYKDGAIHISMSRSAGMSSKHHDLLLILFRQPF